MIASSSDTAVADLELVRVFNNNVVLDKDGAGRDVILTGLSFSNLPTYQNIVGLSLNSLTWDGWSHTTLKPGDELRLTIFPLRSGAPGAPGTPADPSTRTAHRSCPRIRRG